VELSLERVDFLNQVLKIGISDFVFIFYHFNLINLIHITFVLYSMRFFSVYLCIPRPYFDEREKKKSN
jgi:hypothetical protein